MRVPRRRAGTALLVAGLLVAAFAASLSFLVASPGGSGGAGTVGLRPAGPSGPANRTAAAKPGSPGGRATGQPESGTSGRSRASAAVVVDAVSHGGQALVEVTGTVCVASSCVPLTGRVVMPTSAASFGAAWKGLTSGIYGWAASPLPCVQDPSPRQWHVKLA